MAAEGFRLRSQISRWVCSRDLELGRQVLVGVVVMVTDQNVKEELWEERSRGRRSSRDRRGAEAGGGKGGRWREGT